MKQGTETTVEKIIFIGGTSGAGCSTALRILEDFHFNTVGKLPLALVESFIETHKKESLNQRVAILPQIKSKASLDDLLKIIDKIGRASVDVIYLDASDETIVKRYSETRRPHPDFAGPEDKTLVDAIHRERGYLIQLKEMANLVVDTSNLTIHDLKRTIAGYVEQHYAIENNIRVNFVSFGFKHGLPLDCDLIIDVRFLPNPYFIDQFKEKTGLDPEVSKWVLEHDDALRFVDLYLELLRFLIPKYAYEGKAYLNIGVGCTGGKHRSVAIVEALSRKINLPAYKVSCYHKDIQG